MLPKRLSEGENCCHSMTARKVEVLELATAAGSISRVNDAYDTVRLRDARFDISEASNLGNKSASVFDSSSSKPLSKWCVLWLSFSCFKTPFLSALEPRTV